MKTSLKKQIDIDDEKLTKEELEELKQGLADIKAGRTRKIEEVEKKLGLNIKKK